VNTAVAPSNTTWPTGWVVMTGGVTTASVNWRLCPN
jgi:hypothetical protein